MTNEELIIGHFDKTLNAQQETMLETRLSESNEARTMYDQHKTLDAKMTSDAEAIAPSSRLDEKTLAIALSLIPEAIGGGALAWFGTKAVVAITTLVVGGTAVAFFFGNSSEKNPPVPAPAAQHSPMPTPSADVPQVKAPAPAAGADAVPAASGPAETKSENAPATVAGKGISHSSEHRTPRLHIDASKTPELRNGTRVKPSDNK